MEIAVVVAPAGALLGAVVGAAINQRSARRTEAHRLQLDQERQERADRAAARLVEAELARIGAAADLALEVGSWDPLGRASIRAWEAHAPRLAAELPSEEFFVLQRPYDELLKGTLECGRLKHGRRDDPPAPLDERLRAVRESVPQAIQVVWGLSGSLELNLTLLDQIADGDDRTAQ